MTTLPSHLRVKCCTIMWKLLAHSAGKTKRSNHFDLNRTKKWAKPTDAHGASTTQKSAARTGKRRGSGSLSYRLLEGMSDISIDGNGNSENGKGTASNSSNSSNPQLSSAPDPCPSLAEQCGCTEKEFEFARRFPELIGIRNWKSMHICGKSRNEKTTTSTAPSVDCDEVKDKSLTEKTEEGLSGSVDGLSGWGTDTLPSPTLIRQKTIDKHISSRPSSREERQFARIRRALRHELAQALEAKTAITRFSPTELPEFAVPHFLLPTASGLLGHVPMERALLAASPTACDYPLRLDRNACEDLLQAQLECIDRTMQASKMANAAADTLSETNEGRAALSSKALVEAMRPFYDASESKCPEPPKKAVLASGPSSTSSMNPKNASKREILYARQQARCRDHERLQKHIEMVKAKVSLSARLNAMDLSPFVI